MTAILASLIIALAFVAARFAFEVEERWLWRVSFCTVLLGGVILLKQSLGEPDQEPNHIEIRIYISHANNNEEHL